MNTHIDVNDEATLRTLNKELEIMSDVNPFPEHLTDREFFMEIDRCWTCAVHNFNQLIVVTVGFDEMGYSHNLANLRRKALEQALSTCRSYTARTAWEALSWLSIFFELFNMYMLSIEHVMTDQELQIGLRDRRKKSVKYNRELRLRLAGLEDEIEFHMNAETASPPPEVNDLQAKLGEMEVELKKAQTSARNAREEAARRRVEAKKSNNPNK